MLPAVMFLTGCVHKEIEFIGETRLMQVRFDWSKAPHANPEGMTLFFYPLEEGGGRWRYDIAGSDGGPVDIPIGRYRVLTFNNDLPGVNYPISPDDNAPVASAKNIARADSVVKNTGLLYSCENPVVEVTRHKVNFFNKEMQEMCRGDELILLPEQRSVTYTIRLEDCVEAQFAGTIIASLTGLRKDINLATGDTSGDLVCNRVLMHEEDDFQVMEGVITGFPDQDHNSRYLLDIYSGTVADRIWHTTYDVTLQVNNAEDPLNIPIIITGINFPPGDAPGVGMDVGVDGWEQVEIDYPILFPI